MVEAVILPLFGGLIGILSRCTVAFAIANSAGWAALITSGAILLAVGFAGGVGIFFGFYPTHKASNLEPIEALRFE